MKNDFNKSIDGCISLLTDMKIIGYEYCKKPHTRETVLEQLNRVQNLIRVLENSLGLHDY